MGYGSTNVGGGISLPVEIEQVWAVTRERQTRGIAVSKLGNVYSAPYDTDNKLIKYSIDGSEIWTVNSGAATSCVAVDDQENSYHMGAGNKLTKLSPTGGLIWNYPTNIGYINFLNLSKTYDSILAGSSDKTVKKFNSSGALVWTFSGHTATVREAVFLSDNTVYSCSEDMTVRKLTAAGAEVWKMTLPAMVVSITVDDLGYAYVGTKTGKGIIYKIAPNNTKVWEFTANTSDVYDIECATDGNIYFAASSGILWKISPSGKIITTKSPNSKQLLSLDVGDDNYIYVAGAGKQVIKLQQNLGGLVLRDTSTIVNDIYKIGTVVDPITKATEKVAYYR